jgi:hypothetical protein
VTSSLAIHQDTAATVRFPLAHCDAPADRSANAPLARGAVIDSRPGSCFGPMRMLLVLLIAMLSTENATAGEAPSEGAVWKVHLELPVMSGFNHVFRDPLPAWAPADRSSAVQISLIGLCLGRQWVRGWTIEGCARIVILDLGGLELRNELGLRAGRGWTLAEHRTDSGPGWIALLLPMGGLAYRGRGDDFVQGPHEAGQFSFAVTGTLALDYTYFTSARFGWTVRARAEGAYVFHQAGPPIWESDEETHADGYRGRVGGGFDVGVAF